MTMCAFAQRQQRLNRAVRRSLADAQVVFGDASAEPVRGIFYEPSAVGKVGDLGMTTTAPVLHLPDADVPAQPVGQQVSINGKAYEVQDYQPDGGGWTLLILEVLNV